MTQDAKPNTPSTGPSAQVRFGGVLRIAEIYAFIMLIRGAIGTFTGSCSLLFSRPTSEMAAPGLLTAQPITPVLLISFAFAVVSFLGFGTILLRFLRVPTSTARNRIRVILSILSLTFAALGVIALNLPEPTHGVLLPWTESQAFQLGLGQFVDSMLAFLALVLFTLSSRARNYYSDHSGAEPLHQSS